MKPKIFIGSSVEGLNVAYAIQQNLTHCAEPTVWDQGIFELSKTAIESLIETVEKSDFGIFVFSPDDETTIRGQTFNTVRDNVMFEMGLFLGKLTREKVFFILPEGIDLHLPTDLLGMNSGSYNPNRDDKSMQAATGPVCNQIRQVISKNPLSTVEDNSNKTSKKEHDKVEDHTWFIKIFDKEYDTARKILDELLSNKECSKRDEYETWLEYIKFKETGTSGLNDFVSYAIQKIDSYTVILLVIQLLCYDGYHEQASDLINQALSHHNNKDGLIKEKIEVTYHLQGIEAAEDIITTMHLNNNVEALLKLSSLYFIEDSSDANDKSFDLLTPVYKQNKNHKELSFKYAKILNDKDYNKEALYILDDLIERHPDEAEFYGYLSNVCLILDLYDKAMTYSKLALEKYQESTSKAWIYYNIGNMFNNKGFYNEAEKWLHEGLAMNSDSEYAHQRLSSVIKSKTEERRKYTSLIKEGRIAIPNL